MFLLLDQCEFDPLLILLCPIFHVNHLSTSEQTNHNCLLLHIYSLGSTVLRMTLHYVQRISRRFIWAFVFLSFSLFLFLGVLSVYAVAWFDARFSGYFPPTLLHTFWFLVGCAAPMWEYVQVPVVSECNCCINVSECKCSVNHISVFQLIPWISTSHTEP